MKTLARACALLALLAACTGAPQPLRQTSGPITVEDAAMPVVPGANLSTLAVYLSLRNAGEADQITTVSSDFARAEIHETVNANGFMTMRPVLAVDVPAGGTVALKPGGLHIMLIEPRRVFAPGESAKITLGFKSGRSMSVDVLARER